jgi:heparan-alpha-glucosaminide N-acetyltransferase
MMEPAAPSIEKPASSAARERLTSLDAFRGFDILTMVFVNFIAGMPGIPFILRHAPTEMDAYTLTDLVFPGFLFMVGVSIPLALARRREAGQPAVQVLGHVLVRTLALLFLGVIMVNGERFSAADTGLSRSLWYFLAYAAVFALWAVVPKGAGPGRRKLLLVLRIAAAVLLLVLVALFRGKGEDGAVTWFQHSWWGILGMIGWTYLAGCLIFLASRGNRVVLAGAVGFLTALYIGGRHGALDFLGPVNSVFGGGVGSIFGSHTAIVTAGMLAGTLFLPGSGLSKPNDRLRSLSVLGLALLAAGYVLRPLHGFSKNNGTESWALASAGISALAFMLFYLVLDAAKRPGAAAFLVPAGRNPLAAYLLPDLLSSALALIGGLIHFDLWRLLWPFAEKGGWPGMLNAVVMTALVLFLTTLMTRSRFVLKL